MFYQSFLFAQLIVTYLLIGLLGLSIMLGIFFLYKNKNPSKYYFSIVRYSLVLAYLQLTLLTIHYFVSPHYKLWNQLKFSEIFNSSVQRFVLLEQPAVNFLAVFLVTLGYTLHLRQLNPEKLFFRIIIFYGLSLLCFLFGAPIRY